MNRTKLLLCVAWVASCMLTMVSSAEAHSVFKKQMQEKYPNKKISCNACHVDKQPKTERNAYGKLFSKVIGNDKLSATHKEKKGAEKKAYEAEVMTPAFNKAYDKIKAMTFHDLVEAGAIDGITNPEDE